MGITEHPLFDPISPYNSERLLKISPHCEGGNVAQGCRAQSIPGNDWHRSEFLNFGAVDIWGWIIIVALSCGMFSSTLGLYSLEASNIPPQQVVTTQECLQTLPNVSWEQDWSQLRMHGLGLPKTC